MAKASKQNPIYTVYIMSGGKKYNVSSALLSLDLSEREKQIAQSATISLADAEVNGTPLSKTLNVRDRVYIYANDGEKKDEVFRGFIWTRSRKGSSDKQALSLKCYDNLIYFQESEESAYYSSGKSTKDVCQSLCDSWGVSLKYEYQSITHSKLVLRGNLYDIFTADILDLVKARTGKKYVILMDKDIMYIKPVGSNSTIYHFLSKKNVVRVNSECTMDDMITKVIIVAKADDDDDRETIEATVSGDTSKYGTLQKIIDRNDNTTLSAAKKDAQNMIDENGTPKWGYEIVAPDIPWIRKGDLVYVNVGDVEGNMIVTGVDRSIDKSSKQMTLTMEKASDGAGSGEESVDYWVKAIASSGLNIRTGPGTDYGKDGYLRYGAVRHITGEETNSSGSLWLEMEVGGYISAKWTTKVEKVPVSYQIKAIASSGLNIRVGPGTDYGTDGYLKYGEVRDIVSEIPGYGATKWLELKDGGYVGAGRTQKV